MFQALSHGGAAGSAQGDTILRTLSQMAAALAVEFRTRRDLHALQGLDERQLHDIGVGPGELDHAVRFGRPRQAARARPLTGGEPVVPSSWTEWR